MNLEMKITKEDITKILAKYDVAGLIESGAPKDEYDAEAKRIWEKLKLHKNKIGDNTLANFISLTFNDLLLCKVDYEICLKIVKEIKNYV